MKTPRIMLAVALALAALTHLAAAGFPAPLPEFKNEQELAQWRAEQNQAAEAEETGQSAVFYTGKPLLATGQYAFLFRSYDPELARWTSEDPSGFPDGPNRSIYAPIPTFSLDFQGLWAVKYGAGIASSVDPLQFTYQGAQYTVEMKSPAGGGDKSVAVSLLQSFFGVDWQILDNSYSRGTLTISSLGPERVQTSTAGAGFDSTFTTSISPIGTYHVVQIITTNRPISPNTGAPYLDFPTGAPEPFYDTVSLSALSLGFGDLSTRAISSANQSPVTWSADSFLVDYDPNNKIATVFDGGMRWGWTMNKE